MPVDVPALAARLADAALAVADTRVGRRARVAIDGAVPTDVAGLASAVAAAVRGRGRPVAEVDAEDFLRPRSVRLEHGADEGDAGYERWYDTAALRREVLDPLGPEGDGTWLPTLWDAVRDRATRAPRRPSVTGTVLVLRGPFLLRWELADAVDVGVHLVVSPAAMARRLQGPDVVRVTAAWGRYVAEAAPADRADVVLRGDDPARPAMVV